jgi:phosphatidylglycerophosphatase A
MTTSTSRNPSASLARVIATWFGCGYAPVAPGTVGSLAAIAIGIVLEIYFDIGRGTLLLLAAALLLPGIWAAGVVAKLEQREDPGIVVVDEVIGQWVTLAGASLLSWRHWLAALILFRIFDVWKPPPVRQLERLPGGFGIVADDVMAGLYGALAIFLLDRMQFL